MSRLLLLLRAGCTIPSTLAVAPAYNCPASRAGRPPPGPANVTVLLSLSHGHCASRPAQLTGRAAARPRALRALRAAPAAQSSALAGPRFPPQLAPSAPGTPWPSSRPCCEPTPPAQQLWETTTQLDQPLVMRAETPLPPAPHTPGALLLSAFSTPTASTHLGLRQSILRICERSALP
jgi:hypothetical protein